MQIIDPIFDGWNMFGVHNHNMIVLKVQFVIISQ